MFGSGARNKRPTSSDRSSERQRIQVQQNCTALHCGEEKSLTPARGRGVSTEETAVTLRTNDAHADGKGRTASFKPARRLKVKRDDDDDNDAAETR